MRFILMMKEVKKVGYRVCAVALVCLMSWNGSVKAKSEVNDSIAMVNAGRYASRSDVRGLLTMGVPVMAMGAVTNWAMPTYGVTLKSGKADKGVNVADVARLAPAVALLGLKACGVESRSNWGRMLSADAISAVLTVGVTEVLKRGVDEMRPNGEDRRSYPSGHSTIAFMSATMLAKEYGWRSGWYTVGAYTVAAATAASRVVENYHWAPDVIAGAGIGIAATEMGYALTDLIFKNKGLSDGYVKWSNQRDDAEILNRTSVGMRSGLMIPLSHITDNNGLRLGMGVDASVYGNYRLNKCVGIQANVGVSSASMWVDNAERDYVSPLTWLKATVGPSVDVPLCGVLHVVGDAGVGYSHYFALSGRGGDVMNTKCSSVAGAAHVGMLLERTDGVRVSAYAGYECSRLTVNVPEVDEVFKVSAGNTKRWMHGITLGLTTEISF